MLNVLTFELSELSVSLFVESMPPCAFEEQIDTLNHPTC